MSPIQQLKRCQQAVPSLLTAVRIALLPFIWHLWMREQIVASLGLYGLAVITDWADGRLARRFNAVTRFGAFFDSITDIVFLLSLLLLLGLRGVVPVWFFLLPLAVAIVFILSSTRAALRYDPLGKYYGTVLYVAVGVLLCHPSPIVCTILCILTGVLSAAVPASRWMTRPTHA